ncbi:MAG TPA: type III pantothenate kinase [Clostridiales bacterium]|nr:type III pantothenate kinase [Clostridiales bacterium]
MIVCIDIGNSNIKYAIYDKDSLKATFRVSSVNVSTSDEYGVILSDLLNGANVKKSDIKGVIMSSVIPQLNYTMEHMCKDYLGLNPIIVNTKIKTGIKFCVKNPNEVGADRIVNSSACFHKYKKATICIDFGTALTFNAVNSKGEFLGGSIFPGMKTSLDSLVNGTAKLPNIELVMPEKVIATDTVTNMQAGMINGYIGVVEKIVKEMKKELNEECIVVATGGLGEIIARHTSSIDVVDRRLTLDGLRLIYEMNS